LLGIAVAMHALSRRASFGAVVLSVDQRGILDRRLSPRPIAWLEIASICPVHPMRGKVMDIRLRFPMTTLRETRWPVRIGAYCQTAYGAPAITALTKRAARIDDATAGLAAKPSKDSCGPI
jgi:hypothetical protein